jgi:hypothetical protein
MLPVYSFANGHSYQVSQLYKVTPLKPNNATLHCALLCATLCCNALCCCAVLRWGCVPRCAALLVCHPTLCAMLRCAAPQSAVYALRASPPRLPPSAPAPTPAPPILQTVGAQPWGVHFTWTYGGVAGKRSRMREARVWKDPPDYYNAGGFVTVDLEMAAAPADYNSWKENEVWGCWVGLWCGMRVGGAGVRAAAASAAADGAAAVEAKC